ncbi:putative ran-specific GTPase-activating protein isoform X2 [Apostichopus japonicus]|uniref:Putative ran-specific GTPase-activating protein isoform X2 n=1 Tax=Stichopus japonicus TaxID=307972 RepID=A0A2G8KCC3_STIJA|nr:putative ran-specific GTPase-activating protein isoform X2 [Apostichopus japonicus]
MPSSPDIHFEPIVKLATIETKTLEEDEDVIIKLRARLYRYETEADPPEWKERGTGEVKLLKNKGDKSRIRVLMRRDKTLKICANHYVLKDMTLKPNCGSNKAWVWNTPADFADEEPKAETLAIRFGNADHAKEFKEAFENCQKELESLEDEKKDEEKKDSNKEKMANGEKTEEGSKPGGGGGDETNKVTEKLEELTVKEKNEDKTKEDKKDDTAKEEAKTEEAKTEEAN